MKYLFVLFLFVSLGTTSWGQCSCFGNSISMSSSPVPNDPCCYILSFAGDGSCSTVNQNFDQVVFSTAGNGHTMTSINIPGLNYLSFLLNNTMDEVTFTSTGNLSDPLFGFTAEICFSGPNNSLLWDLEISGPGSTNACQVSSSRLLDLSCSTSSCAAFINSSLNCSSDYNSYDYSISFDNLTGVTNNNCMVNVSTNLLGAVVSPGAPTISWNGTIGTVTGQVRVNPTLPTPSVIDLTLDFVCNDNGNISSCSISESFTPGCCNCSGQVTIFPSPFDNCCFDIGLVGNTSCASTDVYDKLTISIDNFPPTINGFTIASTSIPGLSATIDPVNQRFISFDAPNFDLQGYSGPIGSFCIQDNANGAVPLTAELSSTTAPVGTEVCVSEQLWEAAPCQVSCAQIIGDPIINCGLASDQYTFSVDISKLSGLSNCTINITSPQGAVSFTPTQLGTGITTLTGTITLNPSLPLPGTIDLLVNGSCTGANGVSIDCDLPISLIRPCCDCFDAVLTPSSTHPCCLSLMFELTDPDCQILGNFNQIDFTLGSFPNPGSILSVTQGSIPWITPNQTSSTSIQFNAQNNLVGTNLFLTPQTIAEICFDNTPNGTVDFTVEVPESGGLIETCPISGSANTNNLCLCGAIVGGSPNIDCGNQPNVYDFSMTVENTSIYASNNCFITMSSSNAVVNFSATPWSNNQSTISGTLTAPGIPPLTVDVIATINCLTPASDTMKCDLPYSFIKPCCDTVGLLDQMICSTDPSVVVSLVNCPNLNNIATINWYAVDGPCPSVTGGFNPNDWGGTPYTSLVGNSNCDVTIDPNQFSGDICVIAEVVYGPNNPCQIIYSPVAIISDCEAINCTITSNLLEYCFDQAPVVPAPLMLSFPDGLPNCANNLAIQWYDINGPLIGETGMSYQPPALSLAPGSTNCFEEFYYRVEVSDQCGMVSHEVFIRLYNDNAPAGTLALDPVVSTPICFGDAVTLRFSPGCANPFEWTWYDSPDGINWTPIPGSGTVNNLYNTNILTQSTHYKVEVNNGVCPTDEITFLVDVQNELDILSFDAQAVPAACDPTGVDLTVSFAPCTAGLGCACTIEWYHNGQLIGGPSPATSPASFSYAPLPGNYQAIVKDCCGARKLSTEVNIPVPYSVLVDGPCFICNDGPVNLEGILVNLPSGTSCSYQWYEAIGTSLIPIPGETGKILTSNRAGSFVFEANCGGCIQQTTYELVQCGIPDLAPCLDYDLDISGSLFGTEIYQTIGSITSDASVEVGADITYLAENNITLHPGFQVKSGANFYANIEPCSAILLLEEEINTDEVVERILIEQKSLTDRITLNNYPNPFSTITTIAFFLPTEMQAHLSVLDLSGRPIFQKEGKFVQGLHKVAFDGRDIPPGVYIYSLQTSKAKITKSMVLIGN